MKHFSFPTTLAVLLFSISSLYSQAQDLAKAWELLSQNKSTEAHRLFQEASSGSQALEAHLGLYFWAVEYGSAEDQFEELTEIYKLAENPEPYLIALWVRKPVDAEKEQALLKEIIEKHRGQLKAMALQHLGRNLENANQLTKAKEAYNRIGSITKWSVIGEFENISASGFDKDFGPLKHPEKDYEFTNKRGMKVKWFDLKGVKPDKWVDMEYYFYASDAIIYAQNFCKSPKEQEVQFRIGVSGSVKVWLNDQLLFQEEHERNNDLDSYIFTAKLMPGYNRILIQLGESEAGNCNFMLRITDEEGENIKGLQFSTEVQAYPKDYHYTSTVLPDPNEQFFLQEIEKQPDNMGLQLSLIKHYLMRDENYKAKKMLKPLRAQYPDAVLLLAQELEAHLRDDNETMAASLREEIKRKAPDSPSGLSLRFPEAMEQENYDEAETILKSMEKLQGQTAQVLNWKLQLSSARSEQEKFFSLIHEGYQKYPEDYSFVYLEALLAKEVEKNPSKATRILRKYLKTNFNQKAKRDLADFYFEQGYVQEGVAEYTELIKFNPVAVGYYSTLSDIFFQLSKYNNAEKYLKECLQIAPYIGSYHRKLGKTYAEMSNKAKAEKHLKQAIAFNPNDYEARRLLRQLKGQEDVFADIKQYDVYQLFSKAPQAEKYPEDNSIILLNDLQKIVYENGGSEERHVLLIKVFDNAGVDDWKEYSIPVYGNQRGVVEKMEVIKASGKRIEAQRSGRHVVFSNLEPGDAIHISYRVENYYGGKLSTHFWGNQFFSAFIPVHTARLALLVPTSKTFKHLETQPELIRLSQQDKGGYKLYEWTAEKVPAIEYEPYMPEFEDVAALVHYSSIPDWDFVADWYADLVQNKARTDFEVQEVAEELFQGKTYNSDKEKAEAIYNYITDNIRYRSVPFLQSGLIPQKATTTISDRQGDCKDVSTLFVALCRTQGIPSELLLVNTVDRGRNSMPLPSIDFNHCMVKVAADEKEYILELTTEDYPFAGLPITTEKAFSLPIPLNDAQKTKSEPTFIEPPTILPNEVHRQSEVSFENGKMIVTKNNRKTGRSAAGIRNTYKHEGEEKRRKIMREAIRVEGFNTELKELKFEEDLLINAPEVHYFYSYERSPAFTKIGSLRIFQIPWADALSAPAFLNEQERSYPILLWQFTGRELEEETITIHFPEGYALTEKPENVSISTEEVEYELSFEIQGQSLIAKRKIRFLKDSIPPERFQTAYEAFSKIVEADHQNLALQTQ